MNKMLIAICMLLVCNCVGQDLPRVDLVYRPLVTEDIFGRKIDCGVPIQYSDTTDWETVSPGISSDKDSIYMPDWVYKVDRIIDQEPSGISLAINRPYKYCKGWESKVVQYRICRARGWHQKRTITKGMRYEKQLTEYEQLLVKFKKSE